MFPDPLGSGDDDEDNGLEDSSAEIENDQVYFSKGVFLVSLLWEIDAVEPFRWNLIFWPTFLHKQVRTGLIHSVWRKSSTLFQQETL